MFDLEKFYAAVYKVLNPEGVLAAWGYQFPVVEQNIDKIVNEIHKDVVGTYWSDKKSSVENGYSHIYFPFNEISPPESMKYMVKLWTLEEFWGYIYTWSGVQAAVKALDHDPLENYFEKIKFYWAEGEKKAIRFPISYRIGRLHN